MTRSQKASALFGFLAALDALLTALDFLGYVEIGLNRIDFVVSLVSIPLALAVSFGLWGKRLWGWRLGVAYVAFCLVDGLRGTVSDSQTGIEAVAAAGFLCLFLAGILWMIDGERLRAEISPEPPDWRLGPWAPHAWFSRLGLVLLGTGIAASIWGVLVVVLWGGLLTAWRLRSSWASDS